MVYLSSSGATCSTKILGLGGVLRGKELEHLEGGGVGGRVFRGGNIRTGYESKSKGTVKAVELCILFTFHGNVGQRFALTLLIKH